MNLKIINKEQMKRMNTYPPKDNDACIRHSSSMGLLFPSPAPTPLSNTAAILNVSNKTTQNVRFGVPHDTQVRLELSTCLTGRGAGRVTSENWYVLFY